MTSNDRALLQESVKSLVLRHAFHASLVRLSDATGSDAEDELIRLEHSIVTAMRGLGAVPEPMRLSALVAVEDAISVIRAAFDHAHRHREQSEATRANPTLAA